MHAAMTTRIHPLKTPSPEDGARAAAITGREDGPPAAIMSPADGEKRLTVAEAAADAAVSVHTIRRGYENRHLRVQRFGVGGRGIRIRRADLAAWLDAGGRTDAMERR